MRRWLAYLLNAVVLGVLTQALTPDTSYQLSIFTALLIGGTVVGSLASAGASAYGSYQQGESADDALAAQRDWQRQMLQLQGLWDSPDIANDLMGQLFTGDNADALVDYLTNRLPLTKAERQHLQFYNREAGLRAREAAGRMESLIPYADEWARTGFPTDLESITAANKWRLLNEDAPALLEQRGFRLGLGGSGMADLLQGQGVEYELKQGELEFARDEAATARRIQGLSGLVNQLYAAPSDYLQRAFANIGEQGELGRVRKESVRSGAAPPVPSYIDILSMLAGIEQGQIFPVGPGGSMSGGGGGGWGGAGLAGLSSLLSNPNLWSMLGGGGGISAATTVPWASSLANTYNINNPFSGAYDFGSTAGTYGGNYNPGFSDIGLNLDWTA